MVHVGLARHDRALIVASNEHAAAAARLGPLEVELAISITLTLTLTLTLPLPLTLTLWGTHHGLDLPRQP